MVRISDAEFEVMKIIWEKKEVTSLEIIKRLDGHNWNNNTIRTLIGRLIAKKAVGISKREGKTYTYVPLIKENEYKVKRTKSFVRQIYDGALDEMLLNFVDSNELSKSELKVLLHQIEEKIK